MQRIPSLITNQLKKIRKYNGSEKLVDNFLKKGHESQSKTIIALLSNTKLRELFVKCNITIISSAAVERLFSLEKAVLKLKQFGLSDQWWI